MNDKDKQELIEAVTALRMAGADRYADMLEKMEEYWDLECGCSIHDGSYPDCPMHKTECSFCGCAPSYRNYQKEV